MRPFPLSSSNGHPEEAQMDLAGASPATQRKQEAIEFRLLYLVAFTVFLVGALLSRALPRFWRSGERRPLGVVGEARAAAHTFIPFAFMA